MVQPVPDLPATAALLVGDDVLAATPLRLTGHEASVVLDRAVPAARLVELRLTWDDGGCTHLSATVRRVGADGRLADLEVHHVEGDWRPFLTWLGANRPEGG